MGRGGRWQMGRGRGPEPGPGQSGRGWRPAGPPAPPAGQPKLDPKIIEQRRQNTASRLRRFLQPLLISPSLAGENAMAEYNELMQVWLPPPPPPLPPNLTHLDLKGLSAEGC